MNLDEKWILNPNYKFKHDLDRVCMYSIKKLIYEGSADWIGYIHPYHAIILSLFNGANSIKEISGLLSQKFRITQEAALSIIKPFLNNDEQCYTKWQGYTVPFPKKVLIPAQFHDSNTIHIDMPSMDFDWENINLTDDRAHRAPHSILWMLTRSCVTSCGYCYADKQTTYTPLTTSRALEIIDSAKKLNVSYIDVIGGEIFMRKDWNILIKRMVEYDMSPSYISTKMPINKRIVSSLLDTGYQNVIQISLDSIDENILSKTIRAYSGYARDIVMGIERLENAGFSIQINTILTKDTATVENLKSLMNYISTLKNVVYWEIRIPEYSLYSVNRFNNIKASRSQLEEISVYINEVIQAQFEGTILFSTNALEEQLRNAGPDAPCFLGGRCGLLKNNMFILPDGKVGGCEQLYWHPDFIIGDLKTESIESIWQSSRAKELFAMEHKIFRSQSQCSHCKDFTECNKKKRRCIVKVIKAYGSDNWDFPDPRCIYAPEINNNFTY
ncbi:MAG: radical SAM protein [Muribaculaceae bacterium]|nr:radical SAM protein [Muribaculaceae bacterium]